MDNLVGKWRVRVALTLSVAAAIAAVTPTYASAAALHTPEGSAKHAACTVVRVQLNGDRHSMQCLSTASVGPNTGTESHCYTSDLTLWNGTNLSGTVLCLTGTGKLNLNFCWDYTCWNDAAQSFFSGGNKSTYTGGWAGYFYWDINEGGASLWFDGNEICNNLSGHNMGSNLAHWGGQISSVWVYASDSEVPNVC